MPTASLQSHAPYPHKAARIAKPYSYVREVTQTARRSSMIATDGHAPSRRAGTSKAEISSQARIVSFIYAHFRLYSCVPGT